MNPDFMGFPHGPWDYKPRGALGPGRSLPFESVGNFNYGATGAAMGIPPAVLHRAAGLVQMFGGAYDRGNGVPWWRYPYGDQPRDQEMIASGIDYYQQCFR